MENIKKLLRITILLLALTNEGNAQSKQLKENLTFTGITGNEITKQSIEELDGSERIIKKITEQLIKENLVKTEKKLSYMLNHKEFIINGEKQPSEVHEKYKYIYIKNRKKWNICRNYKI